MKKQRILISNIPTVLWGEKSEKVVIAVHGNMSNKEDIPIEIFAKYAIENGYQVLSFDLPEHGDRKKEGTLCKVQICVKELNDIMEYVQVGWQQVSLFANSMGAYFSLLAYKNNTLERAWFLSPLVDMKRMIEKIMKWSNVSEEQLEKEQVIKTPIGQTLYWDYYSYVITHPITTWKVKTDILYGAKDEQCERDILEKFVQNFSCKLKVVPEAEHYFHTQEQLQELEQWLDETMQKKQ